jgi:uncharacterized protein YegL
MNKVLVNFIQDRSGSMSDVWTETLSGFKKFVEDLRDGASKDGVEYLFSLTTFDTQVETPIVGQPIASVAPDELAKHGPRGSTALYDAVGTTIKNTEDNSHGADKIIVVIVTDGHENSSREWNKDTLHKSIEAKLKLGNWTFTYLGTQPETWADAGALGIATGAVANYQGNRATATYSMTANAVRSLSKSVASASPALMSDYLSEEDEVAAGMHVQRPGAKTQSQTPSASKPPNETAKQIRAREHRKWK